jgi:hypothetical protein
MKRSEMIALLKEQVLYHFNCGCCESDDVVYDKVLNALEVAGMQPPRVTLIQLMPDAKIYDERELNNTYACWEPEDEKK